MNLKYFDEGDAFFFTHADLHDVVAAITGAAIALEIAGRVPARAVTAHSMRDLALVDICTLREQFHSWSQFKFFSFHFSFYQQKIFIIL